MNKTIINDAIQIITEYLIDNGKSTAEKLQDEISAKMKIDAGTMDKVYEAAINLMESEILVDFTGVSLKD